MTCRERFLKVSATHKSISASHWAPLSGTPNRFCFCPHSSTTTYISTVDDCQNLPPRSQKEPLSDTMLPNNSMPLTKQDINTTAPSLQTPVYAAFPLQSLLKGSPGYTSAYETDGESIDVDNSQHATVTDSATPPGIAQGCRLLYPCTTLRVPDYDKMRNSCPDEWVKELRNPSLVLAVPERFAMPLPTRPKEVNMANMSAIFDQHWEYRMGGVQLVKTKHSTAIEDHSVSGYV